jgi:hypothetical protein
MTSRVYVRYRYWVDWQGEDGEWRKLVYLTGQQKGSTRYWGSAPEAASQACSVYHVPRGCTLCIHPEAIVEDTRVKSEGPTPSPPQAPA